MPGRLRLWVIGGIATLALGLTVALGVDAWRARVRLDEARAAIARGDHRAAVPRLVRLVEERHGRGEASILLGDCYQALGQHEEARNAWMGIDPASSWAGAAALRRGLLAREAARFSEAEDAFLAATTLPGPRSTEARENLITLFWSEGRFRELGPLIEQHWDDLGRKGRLNVDAALGLLRGHISIDLEAFPIESIEADLRKAAERSPDDDRIWLALGSWATRAGRLADARPWLVRCRSRRPSDVAVGLAWLDLVVAADSPEDAIDAMRKLPAHALKDGEVLRLRAWLASRQGRPNVERAAYERLLALNPGEIGALNPLMKLLADAGAPDAVTRYRERKKRLDAARHRYTTLFKANDILNSAPEMARLARDLDRQFERRILFALVGCREGQHVPVNASPGSRPAARPLPALASAGRTLADAVLGQELTVPPPPPPATARDAPRIFPTFVDDSRAAGLDFTLDTGPTPARQLPETMGGGVGLLDYDGDGWLDVYAVQGGKFPPDPGPAPMGDRLFRNRGDGTFEDTTKRSGLAAFPGGYGHGVAVGDVDNDGHPDLFVTRWRAYALYRNRGDGTFEDLTETAGLGGDRDWPTSAAFADLDNDGDLDLYVCHYLRWDANHPRLCPHTSGKGHASCDPRLFDALPDHLFRNDDGRFVEVTDFGLDDRHGRGLGVVAAAIGPSGLVDLFVANDGTANYYLRNLGGLKFEEVAHDVGVACNGEGAYQAGMGVALGDLDGDGHPDLAVSNFYNESTTFFRNLQHGLYGDQTAGIGLAVPTRSLLGFGLAFLDANNDGHLDLAQANGHVDDNRPAFPHAMPTLLLLGGGPRLVDAAPAAGPDLSAPRVGRGLAVGDLDNDGRLDLLVVAQDAPLAYLHNRTVAPDQHSLTLDLVGRKSNASAIGAVVTVHAGGRRHLAWRSGGGSYLSASDPRLHFGLGRAPRADRVEVRWPSGHAESWKDLDADRGYRLREGDANPATPPPTLPGFALTPPAGP